MVALTAQLVIRTLIKVGDQIYKSKVGNQWSKVGMVTGSNRRKLAMEEVGNRKWDTGSWKPDIGKRKWDAYPGCAAGPCDIWWDSGGSPLGTCSHLHKYKSPLGTCSHLHKYKSPLGTCSHLHKYKFLLTQLCPYMDWAHFLHVWIGQDWNWYSTSTGFKLKIWRHNPI